ncbi:DUF3261 domain-containing protein [Litorilituus lipolyticus]|uniref:DUF3261 domain-containing protein n=1 Tax=Litorilituus lipolyticus TaxID=2491017 RepID=A0A502KQE9_9GAMM|nr:DUF3261 domain-containing protein [Litorilituus lipolyticus]TPH12241.1 DUF3261 domain-containing protein [Litorilituus lipolyticus]
MKLLSHLVKKYCIVMVSAVLLCACSSFSPLKNDSDFLAIFPLQPVPQDLQNIVWLEKFTFDFVRAEQADERSTMANEAMLLQTELSAEAINIAAMSFSGVPLAQASWQTHSQNVTTQRFVAQYFNGQQVLHDLQAVNWPVAHLVKVLPKGYSLSETSSAGKRTRRFYHKEQVIIIVRYQETEQGLNIHFEHKRAGYQLTISRLSETSLV